MVVEGVRVYIVIIDVKGKKVVENILDVCMGSDYVLINFVVKFFELWMVEILVMYQVIFILFDKVGKILYVENQKFGFCIIEICESDGLYINGWCVMIKGVNCYSFCFESGCILSKVKNIEDVLFIKSMNMNVVCLSYYFVDFEFFEVCDLLGFYVMDELSGWYGKYEIINGQKLVKEMIICDVNYLCIIWWSNGNEKGWNIELDGEFYKYDFQKCLVFYL